jgi:hypothetical protein
MAFGVSVMGIRQTIRAAGWRCGRCAMLMCFVPQCRHQIDLRGLITSKALVCRCCLETDRSARRKQRERVRGLYATTGERPTSPFGVLKAIEDISSGSDRGV